MILERMGWSILKVGSLLKSGKERVCVLVFLS